MKVFLTGGAGFIGSALAAELVARGHDVVGLVRDPARARVAGVRWLAGDLARAEALDGDAGAALAAADAVVHAAAVRRDWGLTPGALRRVNVESGPALLARAASARRFLFVSSVAVYGHPEGGAADERAPFRPSKRYGVSKVEAEQALRAVAETRGVPLTIARPGVTYGPGDTYGMIPNLARLLARGRFLLVGNGTSRVNVLWVDDLARGLALALERPEGAGEDFLFAGPEEVPVARLADALARAVGRPVPRLRVPEPAARLVAALLERGYALAGRAAEPFLTKAKVDLFTREDLWSTAKARERLGWRAEVGLEEGIPRFVAWLRQAGELAPGAEGPVRR